MSEQLARRFTTLCLAKGEYKKSGQAWVATLSPRDLPAAAQELLDAEFHIEDVCGLDISEGLMAVYHFDHFTRPGRVTLRVLADRDKPEIPTISHIFQGANWHERETNDFYGIIFTGHPNLIPLLLPEDADFHPLLKEEAARKNAAALLEKGEILDQAAGFTLFDAPVADAPIESGASGEGEAAGEGGK